MKQKLPLIFIIFLINITFSISISRNKISLNENWKFQLNGGEAQTVDIPHDYTMIQPFDASLDAENGFTPGGTGVYTKSFTIDYNGQDLTTILYFYGIYKDAYIKINNVEIGENHYGYNTFYFDISKYIKADGKTINTLEVTVKHDLFSSRFYSGSGMLRGAFLQITDPLHIAVDGLKVTTPDIAKGDGTVEVTTKIVNNANSDAAFQLNINVTDLNGKMLAYGITDEKQLSKNSIKDFKTKLYVDNPKLWNAENPNLYKVDVQIVNGNQVLDKDTAKFGFRYFSFDDKKGFVINGVPTKLKGACIHHDYGALGAIENYDAAYKRLTQLKDMGMNAIRTSHNIPHKSWLTICDELGLYVIEEFFDGWTYPKGDNQEDFSKYFSEIINTKNEILGAETGMTWSEFAVSTTVKRDKNHPCVIMWSIGNEIYGLSEKSPDIAKSLIAVAKKTDESRPFSRADNAFRYNDPIQLQLNNAIVNEWGVIGYNYATHTELKDGADLYGAIYLSESASALNSRGVYTNIQNGGSNNTYHDGHYHLTSYDVSFAPWSSSANYAIWMTLSQDYVAGSFVWTGYDYIGEPTPWNDLSMGSQTGEGAIPNTAYFGVIDTCGFPKDSYYLYRAQFNKDSYTLHIVNAWDKNNICFSDDKKTKTPVHIYSNVKRFDVYRSDVNGPICSGTRDEVTTDAGYKYYTYTAESHDKNLCEAVPSSSSDPGTVLFARFNILFEESTSLYVKGYDENDKVIEDGKISGTHYIATPNKKGLKLEVNVDKTVLKNDGVSLAYVEVSIVDDEGILNSVGEDLVTFSIDNTNSGKILGVDNGDQATVDKFQQKSVLISEDYALIKAYRGKALAIISSKKETGDIKLRVSSGNLGTVETTIKVSQE